MRLGVKMAVQVLLGLLATMLASCADVGATIRHRAWYDLACGRAPIDVVDVGGEAYRASCAGRAATYVCTFDPMGGAAAPPTCRREAER